MSSPGLGSPGRRAVPFVDLSAINGPHRSGLADAFHRVLDSSDFGSGHEVGRFEAEFARAVDTSCAVGMSSGTSALRVALEAAGIGAGDEVILPANTFFATAEAVHSAGATPVVVDIDPVTGLIDLVGAEAHVSARTAALIVVHLYGNPVDMDAAGALAQRHGLFLLEDAAQAIGASWAGRQVGSLADAAAFSFYPTKNLGALGQGGAVTTNDEILAGKIKALREHGEVQRHQHLHWGYNERLHGMQAAFLRAKLADLDASQALRTAAAQHYLHGLDAIDGVTTFPSHPAGRHVHHLMVVRVAQRDRVVAELADRGIETGIHYPVPVHRQPAWLGTYPHVELPQAERHCGSIVSLPLFPGITTDQIDWVLDAVNDITRSISQTEEVVA